MRHNVSVRIPCNAELSYTLFAQGFKTGIPMESEDGAFLTFRFLGGTVIALFYTFAEFRRAYLVTEWESDRDGEGLFLPGIDARLCLLLKAKGRGIDRLKNALRWLTADDEYAPFRLPMVFWQKLARMIESNKGTKNDVICLFDSFRED